MHTPSPTPNPFGPATAGVTPGTFDAAAAWDALPAASQRRAGIASLVLGCALLVGETLDNDDLADDAGGNLAQRSNIAIGESCDLLADLVEPLLGDGDPCLPDLNQLGIRSCRTCGCTDTYGCPDGCAWSKHESLTCSACERVRQ